MELSKAGLYYRWISAWNGDDIDLEEIFDHNVIVRQMPKEQHGIEAVREMIARGRAPFDSVRFTVDVEPIFDDHMLAARWMCHGVYTGGLEGATAEPGTQVVFGGVDIWRFSDGKVTDYWVSSDGLWLMEQLNPGSK